MTILFREPPVNFQQRPVRKNFRACWLVGAPASDAPGRHLESSATLPWSNDLCLHRECARLRAACTGSGLQVNAEEVNVVRRVKSEGKREAIIEAAVEVIATEGVHSATTRKIAAEAGVNL